MNRNSNNLYVCSLWSKYRSGDKKAFKKLYEKHAESLLLYGYKINFNKPLVKDTLQELFIELWNTRHKKEDIKKVDLYLLKAFRNKLLRAIKKENLTSASIMSIDHLQLPDDFEQTLESIQFLQERNLHEHLANLPQRQREVIHLKYFKGLKSSKISEVMNINYQSVSNLTFRALASLKNKIQKKHIG